MAHFRLHFGQTTVRLAMNDDVAMDSSACDHNRLATLNDCDCILSNFMICWLKCVVFFEMVTDLFSCQ